VDWARTNCRQARNSDAENVVKIRTKSCVHFSIANLFARGSQHVAGQLVSEVGDLGELFLKRTQFGFLLHTTMITAMGHVPPPLDFTTVYFFHFTLEL